MATKKLFKTIKGIRHTVAKEARQQYRGFSRILVGILGNCLLGNFK